MLCVSFLVENHHVLIAGANFFFFLFVIIINIIVVTIIIFFSPSSLFLSFFPPPPASSLHFLLLLLPKQRLKLFSLSSKCKKKSVCFSSFLSPQLGIADAEIQNLSAENSEPSMVLPLKRGVGQNIALHTLLTAMNFFLSNFYLPGPFSFICSPAMGSCGRRNWSPIW